MGYLFDNVTADTARAKSSIRMFIACSAIMLEYWQFQWCNGNYDRFKVSIFKINQRTHLHTMCECKFLFISYISRSKFHSLASLLFTLLLSCVYFVPLTCLSFLIQQYLCNVYLVRTSFVAFNFPSLHSVSAAYIRHNSRSRFPSPFCKFSRIFINSHLNSNNRKTTIAVLLPLIPHRLIQNNNSILIK